MDYSQLHKIAKLNNKKFPFTEVIRQIENCEVLRFSNDALLALLKNACRNTITPVNNIEFSGRPNEFGNIVANLYALRMQEFGISIPKAKRF